METGETVYLILTIILTPISLGVMGFVTWWFIRQWGERESAERVEKIWRQREVWGEGICRQLINGEISPGMTSEMVALAWGEPKTVHQVDDTTQRWLYDTIEVEPAQSYVTFRAGQVVEQAGNPPETMKSIGPWAIIAGLIGLALVLSVIILVVVFW